MLRFTILLLLLNSSFASGQLIEKSTDWNDNSEKPDWDLRTKVSTEEFFDLVKYSNKILMNCHTAEINNKDHVIIIRLLNTIRASHEFRAEGGEVFSRFMELIEHCNYINGLASFYGTIPNRGMGYYFPKLQIELGGTPHPYSYYYIE